MKNLDCICRKINLKRTIRGKKIFFKKYFQKKKKNNKIKLVKFIYNNTYC